MGSLSRKDLVKVFGWTVLIEHAVNLLLLPDTKAQESISASIRGSNCGAGVIPAAAG